MPVCGLCRASPGKPPGFTRSQGSQGCAGAPPILPSPSPGPAALARPQLCASSFRELLATHRNGDSPKARGFTVVLALLSAIPSPSSGGAPPVVHVTECL